jgi:hypothetical protein
MLMNKITWIMRMTLRSALGSVLTKRTITETISVLQCTFSVWVSWEAVSEREIIIQITLGTDTYNVKGKEIASGRGQVDQHH